MRAKKGKLEAHKDLCRKQGRMRDVSCFLFNFLYSLYAVACKLQQVTINLITSKLHAFFLVVKQKQHPGFRHILENMESP